MDVSKRSSGEIDDVVNAAWEPVEQGTSNVRGMSYEQGVIAALSWVTGDTDENPMDP